MFNKVTNALTTALKRLNTDKADGPPEAVERTDEPDATTERAMPPDQLHLAVAHETGLWRALDSAYADLLENRTLSCIVCGHKDHRSGFAIHTDECIFGGGLLERYACPSCDCLFGPQKYLDLPEAAVDADYRFLYSRYSESDPLENELRTFRSLSPSKSGAYVNWGCGGAWSQTIDRLRDEGWDVIGYEPSAAAGSDHVVTTVEHLKPPMAGLFSNNVIEHFRDPVAAFELFHGLLADGAKMAHSSPCYDRNYTYTRFHTLFLEGRSPHVLAERTGFRVSETIRDGEYINVVFEKI